MLTWLAELPPSYKSSMFLPENNLALYLFFSSKLCLIWPAVFGKHTSFSCRRCHVKQLQVSGTISTFLFCNVGNLARNIIQYSSN